MCDYSVLGENVKNLRGEISRADFAERLNIGPEQLGRIERGEARPSDDFLFALINKYNVDLNFLYGIKVVPDYVLEIPAQKVSLEKEIKIKCVVGYKKEEDENAI